MALNMFQETRRYQSPRWLSELCVPLALVTRQLTSYSLRSFYYHKKLSVFFFLAWIIKFCSSPLLCRSYWCVNINRIVEAFITFRHGWNVINHRFLLGCYFYYFRNIFQTRHVQKTICKRCVQQRDSRQACYFLFYKSTPLLFSSCPTPIFIIHFGTKSTISHPIPKYHIRTCE